MKKIALALALALLLLPAISFAENISYVDLNMTIFDAGHDSVDGFEAGLKTQQVSNDGFLVKQRVEWVDDNNFQPEIKFFSIDTNTIYPPQLEFKWDDFTYNTGNLPTLSGQDNTIKLGVNV